MASLFATHPRRVAAVTLAVGLLVASGVAWWQDSWNDDTASERFDEVVARETRELVSSLRNYEDGLRGARGVVIATGPDRLTRETFRNYIASRDLEREFPGARGFGFIRRVPADSASAFVVMARRNGTPDFAIRTLRATTTER